MLRDLNLVDSLAEPEAPAPRRRGLTFLVVIGICAAIGVTLFLYGVIGLVRMAAGHA